MIMIVTIFIIGGIFLGPKLSTYNHFGVVKELCQLVILLSLLKKMLTYNI